MRRSLIRLSVATALVSLVVVDPELGTVSQERTPAALTSHPLVGAWLVDTDLDDPTSVPTRLVVHDDGTYLEVAADGIVDIGAWAATGPRAATLTFLCVDEGNTGGTPSMLLTTVEADVTEDAFTALYPDMSYGSEWPSGSRSPSPVSGGEWPSASRSSAPVSGGEWPSASCLTATGIRIPPVESMPTSVAPTLTLAETVETRPRVP